MASTVTSAKPTEAQWQFVPLPRTSPSEPLTTRRTARATAGLCANTASSLSAFPAFQPRNASSRPSTESSKSPQPARQASAIASNDEDEQEALIPPSEESGKLDWPHVPCKVV